MIQWVRFTYDSDGDFINDPEGLSMIQWVRFTYNPEGDCDGGGEMDWREPQGKDLPEGRVLVHPHLQQVGDQSEPDKRYKPTYPRFRFLYSTLTLNLNF